MWSFAYPQIWFTYGPNTKDDSVLRALFEAGATGVRLTFSYGTPELQGERATQLRNVANEVGRTIVIVADLQGEKCRFSKIEGIDEIAIKTGQPFILTAAAADLESSPLRLQIQLPKYLETLQSGDVIIEGDGGLLINVLERTAEGVLCATENDGVIHPGRGIIVRKSDFRPTPMTGKDKEDLTFVARSGLFDMAAISFVGDPMDVSEAKRIIAEEHSSMDVLAKIETQLGIDRIEGIAKEADALMAARGDLALTLPWVELYSAVSKLSDGAKAAGTPWILATQLAEGLERFAFPTRPEICDLAHWISQGAAGAMLSYETAFGPKPVDAVRYVTEIVRRYQSS
jgi:pyruvate kinase